MAFCHKKWPIESRVTQETHSETLGFIIPCRSLRARCPCPIVWLRKALSILYFHSSGISMDIYLGMCFPFQTRQELLKDETTTLWCWNPPFLRVTQYIFLEDVLAPKNYRVEVCCGLACLTRNKHPFKLCFFPKTQMWRAHQKVGCKSSDILSASMGCYNEDGSFQGNVSMLRRLKRLPCCCQLNLSSRLRLNTASIFGRGGQADFPPVSHIHRCSCCPMVLLRTLSQNDWCHWWLMLFLSAMLLKFTFDVYNYCIQVPVCALLSIFASHQSARKGVQWLYK